jgi:hypothetical protein
VLPVLLFALVAHFAVVVTVVMLFVKRTRLTLLGNAWSAFSQPAHSTDVKEHIGDAATEDDDMVLKKLKKLEEKKTGEMRARLRRRSDGVEFVVE